MAIDSTHPKYDAAVNATRLVRDVAFGGGRKVKHARERYLPKLFKQEELEYQSYVQRANFFNAVKRTLSAFTGFVFQKNPDFLVTPDLEPFMVDATMTGSSFYDYCKKVAKEVMSIGRCGTWVDWDSPAREDRPYVVLYLSEDIINWKYARVNGRIRLVLLVLREHGDAPSDTGPTAPAATATDSGTATAADDFGTGQLRDDFVTGQPDEQWREVRLMSDAAGTYVKVMTWRRTVSGKGSKQTVNFEKIDEAIPMRGTEALPTIPFVFHNTQGEEADPDDVPMDDIASINISHYQNSADLEQGRHVCGQPTLVLIGFPKEGDYILGAGHAIVCEDSKAGASAHFLQMDSNSLVALEKALEEKERQMGALGARMLARQGTGAHAEAYQTVQLRQSGESSALGDITIACTQTLSRVLLWVAWWLDRTADKPEDLADTVHVELNTDYVVSTIDATELTALTQAYTVSAISFETYFTRLQRGGVIDSERDMEAELEAIKNSPRALPDGTAIPPKAGGGAAGG